MDVSLFYQVTSDRTRRNGLKLQQGRFRLDIRKNFFLKRLVKYWNRQPRELFQAPSSERFKRHFEVALRDMFSGGLNSVRLMVGHNDLRII